MLTLFLVSVCTVAVPTTLVNAQDEYNVGAWLDRLYYAHVFGDSVAYNDDLEGHRMRAFYIRPQDFFDVNNAIIEMATIYPNTPEYMWGINYGPPTEDPAYPQFTVSGSDPYTYVWDWDGYPIPDAGVNIHTTFPVTFQTGFDFTRLWDADLITEPSVTRLLQIQFTASPEFTDFFNAHISVQLPNTPEASPSIDPGTISVSPADDERGLPWEAWHQMDGEVQVNWAGDPAAGTTYTFSVAVTVENKLYPVPIRYTPSVSVGANYDMPYPEGEDCDVVDSVKVWDDMDGVGGDDETAVTYAATYEGAQLHWWYITQKENSVRFPGFSAAPSLWMEYNTGYWYATTDDVVADEVLEGTLDGYTELQYSDDGTGYTFNEPTLVFEVADGLDVEWWSDEWWVDGTAYRWEFPDRESGQGASAGVGIAGSYPFSSGCEVSRTVNPDIIMFPGGEQEFNFTFTPIDESLNFVHFHIGLPESELFDARIVSPTSDPENRIWLSEDQRSLWIQCGLNWPEDFQPHTFTVTIQVTLHTRASAIRFVPSLHVDARTYGPEQEAIGSSPPPSTTEIGMWTWSASGDYRWRWHESQARNVVLEGYWDTIPYLTVKLTGEFDYLEEEKIMIRLAALLTDDISGAPISDADVALSIYADDGTLLVSDDVMVENIPGTGIYEWQSQDTIEELSKEEGIFTKGIYLVHVQASHHGGPVASDILEFHIDPPGEDFTFPTVPIIALIALCVSLGNTLILLKPSIKRRFQRTVV